MTSRQLPCTYCETNRTLSKVMKTKLNKFLSANSLLVNHMAKACVSTNKSTRDEVANTPTRVFRIHVSYSYVIIKLLC